MPQTPLLGPDQFKVKTIKTKNRKSAFIESATEVTDLSHLEKR